MLGVSTSSKALLLHYAGVETKLHHTTITLLTSSFKQHLCYAMMHHVITMLA